MYLLGIVLSEGVGIENARIPLSKNTVFSYRLLNDTSIGDTFLSTTNWRTFILHSIDKAKTHKHVIVCDIADCYYRMPHYRLDNALRQLQGNANARHQIMHILSNFSSSKSYGVPVGGPAAHILVELVLNLTDQPFKTHGIQFCRYADDYHIFVDSIDEAYDKLAFLSEKFLRNDGLTIQKSKTRIISSSEFILSQNLLISPEEDINSDMSHLFSLDLKFDPYSTTAEEDYEALRLELSRIDILSLLNRELAKTRIHGAVAKRIVSAVRHLKPLVMKDAILTMLNSIEALYPIFPVVEITIKACFDQLDKISQETVCGIIREKIFDKSFVLKNEVNAAYAVRILSKSKSSDNEDALVTLYERFVSPLVRRDIILTMAKWQEFPWLSDKINDYQSVSPWEKRAYIVASYKMGDAGSHWRRQVSATFSPIEKILQTWMSARVSSPTWEIPI